MARYKQLCAECDEWTADECTECSEPVCEDCMDVHMDENHSDEHEHEF